MARKLLVEGLQTNIPDLKYPLTIFFLTKAAKNPIVPTTDYSTFYPGFMLQKYFSFFNVGIICVFTSTFVAICYAASYPFGFPYRIKCPPFYILKFISTALSNQD